MYQQQGKTTAPSVRPPPQTPAAATEAALDVIAQLGLSLGIEAGLAAQLLGDYVLELFRVRAWTLRSHTGVRRGD